MKTSHKHLVILLLASALWTVVGTSCRTFQGFGRDVEHVGGHIERAAR
ncbi:MAG: entericidin A/B family lipoprotein [Prosthecobacter sp.]